jgi:hypothetical protein
VVQEFVGDAVPAVWVSDLYGPQLNAGAAQQQVCLAHRVSRSLRVAGDRREVRAAVA